MTKKTVELGKIVLDMFLNKFFLADDTVAANIAFGVDIDDIDLKAVEKAAKIANLHNFVINELPLKYETEIGEQALGCQEDNAKE